MAADTHDEHTNRSATAHTSNVAANSATRLGLRGILSTIGAGAAVCYGAPLALYAWFAHRPLNWAVFWQHAAQPYATLAAGFGAITAGVLAFYSGQFTREAEQQRHRVEQLQETKRDLHSRFTSATGQLIGDAAMSRQAGVHAIAALADDWHALEPDSGQIQVCVDVLCSYLRRPWNPEDETAAEELVVRETIYAALRNHLHSNAAASWSTCTLNLAGAHLHDIDLRGAVITAADFSNATFTGAVMFPQAKFIATSEQAICFDGASFVATGNFTWTDFHEAAFTSSAVLGIGFDRVQFLAREDGIIRFDDAIFSSSIDAGITFHETRFTTTELGEIRFHDTKFHANNPGQVRFDGGQLPGAIAFISTQFTSTGPRGISFEAAAFLGNDAEIGFPGTRFDVSIDSSIRFDRAVFDTVTFETARFRGTGPVSFHKPARWKNVRFDWDNNPDLKPKNISPTNWPPTTDAPDS